ncbi:MAG: carboxypeptidase-like regulatory domain-containing protein [Bacteroidaceae bacterium]|nr:carboxypeptidase-like regulatory domain-containing protein [Bacteroidaceae bacterium]
MKSYLLFLPFIVLNVFGLSAQNRVLSGIVTDKENSKPLSNVIVMLKTSDGKSILLYTTTDERGSFSLEATTVQKCILAFSLMGYEPISIPVVEGKKNCLITMKPKAVQIKEVVVKAPKIRTKGDTIVYNVARYADSQDKTIADVLKKMPGIEVEKSGKISYNGKSINKFYIEGLDMLEGRYGIATNSLPQRDVTAIEVLENHQPIKALQENEFSEQAALNVKLNKDARVRWLAIVRAGGGLSPALWKGDLSLMQFKGNGQQMYTYKGNNIGEDVIGQHQVLTIEEMLSRMSGDYSLPSYLSMQTTEAADLDESRTLFNRSHTCSGNRLFKLGKDYQLTTRMLYANDIRTSNHFSNTEHFLVDSLMVTECEDETRIHTDALNAEATLQANTKEFFLKNTLGVDASWHSGKADLRGTYPNQETSSSEKVKLSNRLQWVKNIGNRTFTLTSVNSYERKPEHLYVHREESEQHQRIVSSAFYTQTTGSYGWNLHPFTLSLNGGIAGVWRSMESDLQGIPDSLGALNFQSPFKYWYVYASPKLQYKRNDWVITLDVPFHYYSSLSESFLCPRLSVYRELGTQWTISMNGQWNVRPLSDGSHYNGLMMRNYRILQQGYLSMEKQTTSSLGVMLNYKNPIQAFFVNGSASYLRSRNPFLRQQSYLGDYIVYNYLPKSTSSETYWIGGKISKGLDAWELVGTLSASYSNSQSQMLQNGILQPFRSDVFQKKLELNARHSFWMSWNYQLSYLQNRLKSDAYESKTHHWNQKLALTFKPSNRCRLEMTGEHYLNTLADNQTKSFVILDADFSFQVSSKCEFTCRLINLLNEKRYAYTLFGDLVRSYDEYRVRPFCVVVEVYYKF